jgi:hypothetical protein
MISFKVGRSGLRSGAVFQKLDARLLRRWPRRWVLAGALLALLSVAPGAAAQQQLPSPSEAPRGKTIPPGHGGMFDQITPRAPQGDVFQKTPALPSSLPGWPDRPGAKPQPQSVSCDAFKGSGEDMRALRKIAREAAVRRTVASAAFEASVPKDCAGQEWAFYLLFLRDIGQGTL